MAQKESSPVLKPLSGAGQTSLVYGCLYVSITLLLKHTVRLDWLLMPIVGLWVLIHLLERFSLFSRRPVFVGTLLMVFLVAAGGAAAS
ncbi:hypothetical protein [Kitasatospora sp. NPDC094011]|uniref:hypothetical protein n=1 Tax=Kitasatospora sp. NPDC094011 TaxID=3364090 RepID=UPI00380A42D0